MCIRDRARAVLYDGRADLWSYCVKVNKACMSSVTNISWHKNYASVCSLDHHFAQAYSIRPLFAVTNSAFTMIDDFQACYTHRIRTTRCSCRLWIHLSLHGIYVVEIFVSVHNAARSTVFPHVTCFSFSLLVKNKSEVNGMRLDSSSQQLASLLYGN